MKLKEIWKVNQKPFNKDNTQTHNNQYILMSEEDAFNWVNTSNKENTYTDYSIDLSSDLFYNTEFYISEVIEKYPVDSLEDILDFCNKNIPKNSIKEYITAKGLFVGGEKNDLLTSDLKLLIGENSNI